MKAKTKTITVELTATMLNFLDMQVRMGYALSTEEALRFVIVAAIREWERLPGRPSPIAVFPS